MYNQNATKRDLPTKAQSFVAHNDALQKLVCQIEFAEKEALRKQPTSAKFYALILFCLRCQGKSKSLHKIHNTAEIANIFKSNIVILAHFWHIV